MAITINGTGTITGISAGGLPDNCVTAADLATTLDLSSSTITLPSGTGGKILQVVSTTKTSKFATNSTSFVDVTGLSVSITPSSTSSKILIITNIAGSAYTNQNGFWKLVRDSTSIALGTHTSATNKVTGAFYTGQSDNGNQSLFMNLTHLDSPATTSATTYKVQVAHTTSSTYMTINSRASDDYVGAVSSITVMEVAG